MNGAGTHPATLPVSVTDTPNLGVDNCYASPAPQRPPATDRGQLKPSAEHNTAKRSASLREWSIVCYRSVLIRELLDA